MLIQSIMIEDKKECNKNYNKDGIKLIQFILENLLNNNKNTGIISKLIFKIIDKTKELNK